MRSRPARRSRRRAAREGRLGLAAALLALVAFGLRGDLTAPALDGPFRHDGLPVGVVLEAVLAGLMIALAIRHSRAPRDALIAARLRVLLTYLVGIGLIAIPVAYLFDTAAHVHLRPPGQARPGSLSAPAGPAATALGDRGRWSSFHGAARPAS